METQVVLNGEQRTFPAQTTLADVVRVLDLPADRLAIEMNRTIVKRDLWVATTIDSGAEIEIVQFVGGG